MSDHTTSQQVLCADKRCEHSQGWHRHGTGSCLECGCTAFQRGNEPRYRKVTPRTPERGNEPDLDAISARIKGALGWIQDPPGSAPSLERRDAEAAVDTLVGRVRDLTSERDQARDAYSAILPDWQAAEARVAQLETALREIIDLHPGHRAANVARAVLVSAGQGDAP